MDKKLLINYIEISYTLAILALQSGRYQKDLDYREAVDSVIILYRELQGE